MITVSCVMPTKARPALALQAINLFLEQSFEGAELIIVDEQPSTLCRAIPDVPKLRYILCDRRTSLGEKLNVGAAAAKGEIITKWDDDDFYSPFYISTMVAAIREIDLQRHIVAISRLLVYVMGDTCIRDAGDGWFAGGTYWFSRDTWKKAPFPPVDKRVDVGFLEAHPELQRHGVESPGLYVLFRHLRHTWNHIVPEVVIPDSSSKETVDVTNFFRTCPAYQLSPNAVFRNHVGFYMEFHQHKDRFPL